MSLGGSLITRGGLIFAGSTVDSTLRAYDITTGKILWEQSLPASAIASPMTYLDNSGVQYIVVAAGGHEGLGTLGDTVIAWKLKD